MRRRRPTTRVTVAITVMALAGTAACSRSGSDSAGGGASASPSATSSTSAAPAAGDFGSAKKVCAPGPGTGGSGRGISGKTIKVGVLADPGSSIAPGLGQEFFDVADAFAKWCNAAGGINGRTIVVEHHDAKIFNTAQQVINACQTDFMLVGSGNGLDAPGAAPRVKCKLGQIPGYVVSPQAVNAGYQVTPVVSTPDKYPVGALRLLADAYPASQQNLGIAGSSTASLAPQGLRAQEAWVQLGYKVATLQPRPLQIDNYRPWIEQLRTAGAKGDFEITSTNLSPLITAMKDTGYTPNWVLFGTPVYTPDSVKAAQSVGTLPKSYVSLSHLPWEVADEYPVVQQAKTILAAGVKKPLYDDFTMEGFNAWVLWAQSATACGTSLTQECVLAKAGAITDWTAGGLFPPVKLAPALKDYTDCTLLMELTKSGWVVAKDVTKPNNGVYNCDPKNLTKVKSYQTGN